MKKIGLFNTFFFCILLLPVLSFGVQKGDNWSNRPFIKRSAGQKKTPARDGKRNNNKNNKKTSELKKTLAWYKKPAAFYAAGGVASAALGAYAIFKYMQGEEVVLTPEGVLP